MQPIPPHDDKIALHQLQHQAVRDLAWCCFSAPMMNELPGTSITILPFDNHSLWPWLHALDQDPQKLLDHLSQIKSTRLGIYYEALWHFYFSHHPDWELLHHNLQIDRNGITLGAFDFLCRKGDEYWHIETAVKFYLSNAANPLAAHDWKFWVGPEGKDRLDLKLNHLRQHQLPLHQTDEAKLQLNQHYPQVKTWQTGLCMQGYLFSPSRLQHQPAFSNAQHGRGNWWHLGEFLQGALNSADQRWLVLERQHWLSPAQRTGEDELLTTEQLAEKLLREITETKRPLLIAAMKKKLLPINDKNRREIWMESARTFIVADDWLDHPVRPGNAAPSRKT